LYSRERCRLRVRECTGADGDGDVDLSKKHDKLVRQVDGVNKVLRELTPLEGGTEDAEALEGWVRMMNGKVTMITEEMKRLQDKINCER
jgi:hypothetical protein